MDFVVTSLCRRRTPSYLTQVCTFVTVFSLRDNMRESFYFVCFIQGYRKNECGLDKNKVIELFLQA